MESPFRIEPPKLEREKSFFVKMREFFVEHAKEAFEKILPSDDIKDMPPKYMYGLGITMLLLLASLFAYLFFSSYFSALGTQYLSPLSGTTASKYCETIGVANTGTYLATQSGYWEGTSGFQYAEASYQADVTSFLVSVSDYSTTMENLYEDLVYIGNASSNLDLGLNLIIWSSFTALPDPTNSAQRFSLVGDPLVIFNRQYYAGTVSSISGVCNATSLASYDEGRGYLTLTYSYSNYNASSVCREAVNPYYFGYLPGLNTELWNVYFDVRTLMTGAAMNLGIITFDQIVEITADRSTFEYDGVVYNTSSYYDPQFPGMQPLTCIKGFKTPLCAIVLGTIYGMPFFLHKGNSSSYPQRCDCNRMSDFEKQYSYSPCNLFTFMTGFLYYESATPNELFELIAKYNYSTSIFDELVFNASYIASYWGQTSPLRDELNSPASREKAYEFCRLGNITCKLVTFSTFDFNSNWAISNYYFQLQAGACQDTISTSYENW